MSFQNPGGFGPPAGGAPPAGGGAPPGFGPPPGGFGAPPPGGFGGPPGYVPPPGYGEPAPGVAPQGGGPGGTRTELMAILSLVAGLVSIPAWWCCYAGAPIGIVAIVLGIIAIIKINKEPHLWAGKGLAYGGIAAAVAGFLIVAAVLIFYGAALFMMKP